MDVNEINEIYKSKAGDELAKEELLPVVKKYLKAKAPKILEIGCGYGRNLYALSHIPKSQITGCDISEGELKEAEKKMKSYQITNVKTILQKESDRLPFADDSFDFVVIWQVVEHIPSKEEKQKFINESTRILKDRGHILIETPNFLFPFDYHDSGLPFVHWILPKKWRRKITKIIRKEDFPPSQYTTVYQLKKLFRRNPNIKSFEQKTKVYFEDCYGDVFRNLGGTRIKFKKIFFSLYAPLYYFLKLLRLPGDTFTPSLRLVYKIRK